MCKATRYEVGNLLPIPDSETNGRLLALCLCCP